MLCLEFVCLSDKQRNLGFQANQRAQEWKTVKAAFPVWEM